MWGESNVGATSPKRSPLYATHEALGARFMEFAGWLMPVSYTGAIEEHLAVRTAAGLFDVSHMGRLEIRGRDALALIQKVTCNDAARLRDHQVQYSALTTERGTFVDDLTVYRFREDHFLLCVNAANREKDLQWILRHRTDEDAEVYDVSEHLAQLALQGPASGEILQHLTEVQLDHIRPYWFEQGEVAGIRGVISRTGYTGEDGFELYIPVASAEWVWNRILDVGHRAGVKPCGLAARNTLRLEARMLLYGNDIDETTTVWEADLGGIVKLEKGEFIGREALRRQKQEGVRRKLVGFEVHDRAPARDGYPVLIRGEVVGRVTSGSYAPFLRKNIGLTYLPIEYAEIGMRFCIRVRGRDVEAEVVPTPFYRRPR